MRLYAWAHAMTPAEVTRALAHFPGLGGVLYASNYAAAADLVVPPIAYVGSVAHAVTVAGMARAGVRWHAAIVNDERNQTGPSGAFVAPEQYATQFAEIAAVLAEAGVPVSTMGLAPKRTWWRDMFRCRTFDDWYHARLPDADLRAFNPNGVRRRELDRAMSKGHRWILSPAPFRGWWDHLNSPIRNWAELARDARVHAVALWCLREAKNGDGTPQREHGLLDRRGNVTRVGRAVLNTL